MAFINSLPLLSLSLRVQSSTALSSLTSHKLTRHVAHRVARTSGTSPLQARPRMTATAHPESLGAAWPAFADRMRESGEVPALDEWHVLLDGCIRAKDESSSAVWLLNLMHETGVKPSTVTYEKLLVICGNHGDRVAAFHLIEKMLKDKIKLGDLELPDGMEDTLRKILPPDLFE